MLRSARRAVVPIAMAHWTSILEQASVWRARRRDESRSGRSPKAPRRPTQARFAAAARGVARRTITDEEIIERCVYGSVNEAFKIVLSAFDTAINKGKERYTTREDRMHMVTHNSYNSEFWDADRKLWDLFDPLWAMRTVFSDVSPWGITGKARRRLRKTLNNALFTFETKLEEAGGKDHWDRVAAETREVLKQDCRAAIARVLGKILFGVVEIFWDVLIIRPSRILVSPLADAIPDVVKQFVDPEDILEQTLNAVLLQCCANVFQPYTERIQL